MNLTKVIKNGGSVSLIVVILMLLSSCGPVYKIGYDLTPPKTKSGLACVTGCQLKHQQCNVGCARQFKQCGYEAALKAKRKMPELLEAYPQQLESWSNEYQSYQRELDFYEFRVEMAETHRELYFANCKQHKKKKACHKNYGGHPFDDLDRPYFNKPRPIKPTLEKETAKIKKATCSNNCACEQSHRTCFTSCGGIVKSKKICIKNCGNNSSGK